jgi:hypothetical protein
MRTAHLLFLSTALALSAACGGGDDGVDLAGDSPDQAADEIATATCDRRAECEGWNYELMFDGEGNVVDCNPVLDPVDRDACVSETRADVREDLECAMPSDDELGQIADCVNDIIEQDCLTEEDIQAYCDDLLADGEADEPVESPPSCDALDVILEGCDDGL